MKKREKLWVQQCHLLFYVQLSVFDFVMRPEVSRRVVR